MPLTFVLTIAVLTFCMTVGSSVTSLRERMAFNRTYYFFGAVLSAAVCGMSLRFIISLLLGK